MKKLLIFLLISATTFAQTTTIYAPTHSVTMGNYNRIPIYYSLKHLGTNTIVHEVFDTEGAIYSTNVRQNNHPNPPISIPTGNYEVKVCNLAKDRMEVRFELYDMTVFTTVGTRMLDRQVMAGQCYTYNVTLTTVPWTYKMNVKGMFYNSTTATFAESPPFSASLVSNITVGTRKSCTVGSAGVTIEFVPTAGQALTPGNTWATLPNTLQIAGVSNPFVIY